MDKIEIRLSFLGQDADNNETEFYDASQALIGFERSIALTTHLILNNEIIVQAPSLKNARILARPPRAGSWEIVAGLVVLGGALYKLGTAPKGTPLGHVVYSVYDYVISTSLGFSVDYEKSLGQQVKALKESGTDVSGLEQERLDSLIEKCEIAIREMHRPIVKSRTAREARIAVGFDGEMKLLSHPLTQQTYEHMAHTERTSTPIEYFGKISSYNINTYKGRIYIQKLGRPIPFELSDSARDDISIAAITRSLSDNAQRAGDNKLGEIGFVVFENMSRADVLKSFYVVGVI